jgi:hypothetical protein
LREDENSRTFGLHRFEEFVENQHLSCSFYEMFIGSERRSRFGTVEEVRVVTAFLCVI